MKHINYILTIFFVFGFLSCTKDFGDINSDPNNMTEVGSENLFHNIVGALGQPIPSNGIETQVCAPMMQYIATTNGNYDVIGNTYTIDGTALGIFSGQWRSFSVDYLRYINLIEDQLKNEENTSVKLAQTDVLRAMLCNYFTSIYGPIPYDEAGRGLDGIIYPVYRTEKEVFLGTSDFKGILQLLDEAITIFINSTDEAFANDIMYNGDKNKWAKFAASLLLRTAMQISNVEPEIAKQYVNKAFNAGVITSISDIAMINHQLTITGQPGYLDNGLANDIRARIDSRGYCYGRSYIQALKEYSVSAIDPRLKYVAAVYNSGGTYFSNIESYVGMKNGCEMDDVAAVLEQMTFDQDFEKGIGTHGFATFNKNTILNRTSSYIVLNPAEVNFLLAEAVVKGYIEGDADTYYRAGIRTAMESTRELNAEITDAEIDNYINALPVLGSNVALGMQGELDEIMTQKWLASFENSMLAWNDWRRTHYPSIITNNPIENKLGVTNGKIPGRLPYPQDEAIRNKSSYDFGVQNLATKTDSYMNDLWWAKPNFK